MFFPEASGVWQHFQVAKPFAYIPSSLPTHSHRRVAYQRPLNVEYMYYTYKAAGIPEVKLCLVDWHRYQCPMTSFGMFLPALPALPACLSVYVPC